MRGLQAAVVPMRVKRGLREAGLGGFRAASENPGCCGGTPAWRGAVLLFGLGIWSLVFLILRPALAAGAGLVSTVMRWAEGRVTLSDRDLERFYRAWGKDVRVYHCFRCRERDVASDHAGLGPAGVRNRGREFWCRGSPTYPRLAGERDGSAAAGAGP